MSRTEFLIFFSLIIETTMPHFAITYANTPGSHFDFDYYLDTHLPLSDRLLKPYGFVSSHVEKGKVNSRDESPEFICITRLFFEDEERMHAGFAEHGEELRADIENYTTIGPVFTAMELIS